MTELSDELTAAVYRSARYISSAYHVELSDVKQEITLWVLENTERVEKNVREEKWWSLTRSLNAAGTKYALREKAARGGYEVEDVFFYTTDQIAAMLPYVCGQMAIADSALGYSLESGGGGGLSSEGSNLLAMKSDVLAAVKKLSDDDIEYLFVVVDSGLDWEGIAEMRGIQPNSAWKRYDRLLAKIQGSLGGPKPNGQTGTRRAISNARARAITQEDQ